MPSTQRTKRNERPCGANVAVWVLLLVYFAIAIDRQALIARGQTRLPDTASAPGLPEPIYWKQHLFLVPYQWDSAAEAGAAHAVWLFVSKDRGASWQKISEARPNVTSFNYRAEGDGEYWFAVRTLDNLGRAWPAGEYQPELRVIVDTTMPQISQLSARQLADGSIEIVGLASDANLDPASLKIEAQVDAAGTWQPVPIQLAGSHPEGTRQGAGRGAQGLLPAPRSQLHAVWQPPPGSRPLAIRATLLDLAGNPATYQAQITASPDDSFATTQPPPIFPAPTTAPTGPTPPTGWISSSAAVAVQSSPDPAAQPWPAIATHRAPFRLFSSGPSLPDDGITAYGNPAAISGPQNVNSIVEQNDQRVAARYAGAVVHGAHDLATRGVASDHPEPNFTVLEPFRQASVQPLPTTIAAGATIVDPPPGDLCELQHTPSVQPKLVGSRTFALEYDLDDTGRWGVTNVELWGTRDGGRTWHSYARDDDQRSPLVVTVDDEGLYGFRIVVESAAAVLQPPSSGDQPELWVAVDLHRPVIELTAVERGDGNLADHLILRWQAADDNLEPRPISLFYSSRPAGPWSAIATRLENTGEYAWRVERHVPARFYLRAETRDIAGNLAAYQTREPVEFATLEPSGRLRDAESMGPTATGIDPSYR